MSARDLTQLDAELAAAKARFGLASDAPVVSCYDERWLRGKARYLFVQGPAQSYRLDDRAGEGYFRRATHSSEPAAGSSSPGGGMKFMVKWNIDQDKMDAGAQGLFVADTCPARR
jgi:hypothetical protein